MKNPKYIKHIFIMVITLMFSLGAFSQMTAPEDPGGEPVGEDPLGGGAPISGGALLLIAFGAAYGAKKVYDLQQNITR